MSELAIGATLIVVRLLLALIFYGTPLVGFWLASSLTAYLGAPQWMAWTAGAFLFPIIPGTWELSAWLRRRPKSKAWLTPVDRLSIRTFIVGLAFLAVLLIVYPQTAFVSLSTRGDWMLDGVKDSRADSARRVLFAAAGGLEWLYRATKNNPYKEYIDKGARERSDEAAQQRKQEVAKSQETTRPHDKVVAEQGQAQSTHFEQEEARKQSLFFHPDQEAARKNSLFFHPERNETVAEHEQEAARLAAEVKWPWKETTLHPAVATMPASVETSIESVAHYIAEHESDPVMRIKALHDYVADRIAYDSESFYAHVYPRQDAAYVFAHRKGVCAGYANLLSALAEACNEQIVVVTGDARDPAGDKLAGGGHAWNAARIGDRWYPVDACWDSGYISPEKGFTKCYKTDYFLPPPEVMIEDHFPEQVTWQLLAQPLSLGEFLRQPMLRASFQAADLTLVSPQRARNESGSNAVAILKNPKNQWLMAGLEQNGKQLDYKSTPTNSETAELECLLPEKGAYRLNMFVNKQNQYGQYELVGSVDFVNR